MANVDDVKDDAGAQSRFTAGLGRCWPWSHKYTAWTDTNNVSKSRTSDDTLVAHGVLQQRRCLRCGRLQLRVAWA